MSRRVAADRGRREAPPAAPGPVAAAFVVFGMFWGSWAVLITDVKAAFDLSDGALGVLLAVAIALAGVVGGVAGHHADRFGTGRMLALSLGAWALLLVATSAAPTFDVFAACFVGAEVAGGCIDTAMNAASSQRLLGRPGALVRFHALFNTGALSGAAAAGLLLHAGLSWRLVWPMLAMGALGVAGWTWRSDVAAARATVAAPGPPAPGPPAPAGSPTTAAPGPAAGPPGRTGGARWRRPLHDLRADGLVLFLLVFALAEVTEGGIDTWGVLFLRTELAAGVLLGAGAYVVGQGVAALTRGGGGPLLGRLSARTALVAGGLVAAGGILLESVSPQAAVAACGLAVGAGGASLFWPLVMSEATTRATHPTRAAGAFTAAGYMGLVAGAPLVGWVADTWGLNRGLQLLAVASAAVSLCALAGRRRRVAAAASG